MVYSRDMPNLIYSYWLIPAGEDAAPYQTVITALAASQSGAALFQPHMSLGSLTRQIETPAPLIDALQGLRLEPIDVASTAVFTKALFVSFGLSSTLKNARQILEALPGFHTSRVFEPHISLCYGPPPEGAADRSDVTALLDTSVRFAALAEMQITLPVEDYDAVRAWREVKRWGL